METSFTLPLLPVDAILVMIKASLVWMVVVFVLECLKSLWLEYRQYRQKE
jgi:hypothetical protein